MMKMKIILLASILILLAGCVPKEIIDDVQLIHAIGFDELPDGNIQGTITYPIFEQDGKVRVEYLSAVSHTSRFLRSKLNTKSPKTLAAGQLRIVLFNHKFARKGILDIMNSLYRDPNVGNRLFLSVVEGNTNKLLTNEYTATPLPSIYIMELLEQNIKSENLPRTNLHVFLYSYYGEGIDPFLPIIKSEKNSLQLNGIALFRDDKYVGRINHKESFVFKILLEGSRTGNYEVQLKKGKRKGHSVIRNIKGTASYKVKKVNGVPEFNIKLKILGEIHEYPPWLDLENKQNIQLVEKTLTKEINKDAKKIIAKFQRLNVDPLGLGDQVRRREKNWVFKRFKEQYPDMKISVSTDFEIVESGVIE
ncbi:Ger(x)C family spore germination protein [Fictibacillus phosphorivorans]|uniref:Ger(x)C family spore germination protein n=1 Tax=Fictibacillus phosphorivorans TaxID=1221500 RepID=UPI00203D4884|nr:Ger(x)C family spore germination protein [Fictibacillus phosphorivorans]MCM3718194.1 Ger(x)C family spore germination protein [Fictibacillus phosphorivorans]MCM3775939.1 Ger(x)C family spore germination protein [Fictibacillus phosphorivorans]